MTIGLGAWLAATAGALAGVFDGRLRPEPHHGSPLLGAVAGAIIGVLAYGAFLAAGLVVGLLTWNTTLEPECDTGQPFVAARLNHGRRQGELLELLITSGPNEGRLLLTSTA